MRKIALLIFALLSLTLNILSAQNGGAAQDGSVERKYSLGFWAHFNLNQYDADFKKLPDTYCCSPGFGDGESYGFSGGFLYELPLLSFWYLDFRIGYYYKSGALIFKEEKTIILGDEPAKAKVEHKIDATLGSAVFQPSFGFRIFDGLALNLGVTAGYYIPRHFKQTETLIEPENGAFDESGRKMWLYYDSDTLPMPNVSLDFMARLSWEFPLNSRRTVWLAPEIAYNHGLNSIFEKSDWDGKWNINIISFGLALKFSPSYGLGLDITPSSQPLNVNRYELCNNTTTYFCEPDSVVFDVFTNSETGIKNYNYAIKHKDITLDWNDVAKPLPDAIIWKVPQHLPEKLYNLSDSLKYVLQVEDNVGQKLVDSAYLVVRRADYKLGVSVDMFEINSDKNVNTIDIEDIRSGSKSVSTTAKPSQVYLQTAFTSMGGLKKWKLKLKTTLGSVFDSSGSGSLPDRIYLNMNTALQNLPGDYSGELAYNIEIIDSMGNICSAEKKLTINRQELSVAANFRTFGRTPVDSTFIVKENPKIKIEERISTRLQPLLNYVFFDENSSAIPERYIKIEPAATNSFRIDDVHDLPTMETYYNILNIIGKRMQQFPDASITITGCNANAGAEKNNLALSENRAKSVRNYLQEVWNISGDRLVLASPRNLPEQASSAKAKDAQDLKDGLEENRRVEISSDNYEIIKPILTYGKRYFVEPPRIFFTPSIESSLSVNEWDFNINARNNPLDTFDGKYNIPDTIWWNVEKQKIGIADSRVNFLNTEFNVKTEKGLGAFAENVIPVDVISKSEGEGKDTTYDEYSLILFDFGSDKIGDNNQKIMDIIKQRVNPGAIISIVGHTDRVGKDAHNLSLSEKRANSAERNLGFDRRDYSVSSRGSGEQDMLYPNGLPEARFYCRTVKIEVANPVIK